MSVNNLIIIFILFFNGHFLFAQTEGYLPLSYESPEEAELIATLEKKLKQDLATLPASDNEDIARIYEARTQRLIGKIQNNHFIFGASLNERLERILDHILENNPDIPKDQLRIFLSRYPWPNASCLGEGSMVFNIGLIRRLENDDQIAFIICHELAHFTEDHVNGSIRKNVTARQNLLNSSEFKEIAKQEYGRYEATQNMLRDFTFDHKRHSRTHEKEADNLGMKYYLNTSYSRLQATRCLEILDKIDQEKYAGKINIKKIFDNPEYPFQDRWLRKKTGGLSAMKKNASEWNIDSLKTHPDCTERIELIKTNFLNKSADGSDAMPGETGLDHDIMIADFEIVQSTYDFDDLGRCLYYSFQLLEIYPENGYLRTMIGRCLYHLYQARKNHELKNFVEFPSRQEKEYRQVLQFIHNLRLSELKKVNYHYLKSADPEFRKNEDYLFTLVLSSSLMENNQDYRKFAADYRQNFPDGKYSEWLESLN